MVGIAINGFGRSGRCAFRAAITDPEVEIVAVNGTSNPKTMAHLLKYDSNYGALGKEVVIHENNWIIEGKKIRITAERSLDNLAWEGVDVILECTGEFTERKDAEKHLKAGAKKVIVGAPAKGEDITIVLGVNEKKYDKTKHHLISNASCTTNCLAPVAKVLHDHFGIVKGLMTTVHAYTSDQRLLDGTHKDLRRARSAATSMVPTTTGAAKALKLVIPEMDGKLNGFAIRVPTATVSLVDLTVELTKSATVEEINTAFKNAAQGGMKNILSVCEEPLVSVDFKGNPHSAIVDAQSTMCIGNIAKVLAWYDNEWAYSKRLVELAKFVMR